MPILENLYVCVRGNVTLNVVCYLDGSLVGVVMVYKAAHETNDDARWIRGWVTVHRAIRSRE
jgi:hypothetical protein